MAGQIREFTESVTVSYGDATIVMYGRSREQLLDDPTPACLAFNERGVTVVDPGDLVLRAGRKVHPGLPGAWRKSRRVETLPRMPLDYWRL